MLTGHSLLLKDKMALYTDGTTPATLDDVMQWMVDNSYLGYILSSIPVTPGMGLQGIIDPITVMESNAQGTLPSSAVAGPYGGSLYLSYISPDYTIGAWQGEFNPVAYIGADYVMNS